MVLGVGPARCELFVVRQAGALEKLRVSDDRARDARTRPTQFTRLKNRLCWVKGLRIAEKAKLVLKVSCETEGSWDSLAERWPKS